MSQVRYLVGYQPHDRGRDALRLGIALVEAWGGALDIVFVVHEHETFAPAYPPVGRDESIIAEQATQWLQTLTDGLPKHIEAATHVRFAPSTPTGLMLAAEEFGSDLIVVGAGSTSALRRHALGSVATTLLHSSSRPVALAPRNYRAQRPIDQIDCAVGLRSGGQGVLDEAVEIAARRHLPLRLITLVDLHGRVGDDEVAAVRAKVESLLARAVSRYGQPASTSVVTARGDISAAVATTPWHPSSVLLVGSGRLAAPRRLFLGSTVSKMLRSLTIPVIAVPQRGVGDSPAGA